MIDQGIVQIVLKNVGLRLNLLQKVKRILNFVCHNAMRKVIFLFKLHRSFFQVFKFGFFLNNFRLNVVLLLQQCLNTFYIFSKIIISKNFVYFLKPIGDFINVVNKFDSFIGLFKSKMFYFGSFLQMVPFCSEFFHLLE